MKCLPISLLCGAGWLVDESDVCAAWLGRQQLAVTRLRPVHRDGTNL